MGTKHARPSFIFLETVAEWGNLNHVPVQFSRDKSGTWLAHLKRGEAVATIVEQLPTPKRRVVAGHAPDGKRIMRDRPAENLTDYQHRMWDVLEAAIDRAVHEVHEKWRRQKYEVVTLDKGREFAVT